SISCNSNIVPNLTPILSFELPSITELFQNPRKMLRLVQASIKIISTIDLMCIYFFHHSFS
ncbi:MAG: hypothetical protein ACTHJ7_10790, partial [Candidatus Nitrosocosmicus sp.]